ncbi:hypothetical protein FOA52_002362 [Chlamydomonas sp. UWO 241]|nr:hypothetical protein FOA52_002362 [Chlamydomonas sp. UWO 241]
MHPLRASPIGGSCGASTSLRCAPASQRSLRRSRTARPSPLARSQKQDDAASSLTELEEQRLTATLTGVGVSGTAAVWGAQIAGINLFDASLWGTSWLPTALAVALPVLALDAALLLPKNHAAADSSTARAAAAGQPDGTGDLNAERLLALKADLKLGTPQSGLRAMPTLYQMVATLPLAPGSRLGTTPRVGLEAAFIALRGVARELLWCGLCVTFLAAWLKDRAFEAGIDDVAFSVALPPLLPLLADSTASSTAAVAAQARLLLGAGGGDLAGTAGAGAPVYTADLVRWVAGGVATLAAVPAVLLQARAAGAAVASVAGYVTAYDDADDRSLDPLIREYRAMEAASIQGAAWLAPTAFTLTAARGLLRFGALNALFVASGSLSASLVFALVTDLSLLVLCETGRGSLPEVAPSEE